MRDIPEVKNITYQRFKIPASLFWFMFLGVVVFTALLVAGIYIGMLISGVIS